jgi:hypothetical protein
MFLIFLTSPSSYSFPDDPGCKNKRCSDDDAENLPSPVPFLSGRENMVISWVFEMVAYRFPGTLNMVD